MKKILTVILAVMLMLLMAHAAFAESYPEFNYETRTVTLNSGYEISLSRPLLREPDLPNKLQNGESREAKCISCNRCYSSSCHRCAFRK